MRLFFNSIYEWYLFYKWGLNRFYENRFDNENYYEGVEREHIKKMLNNHCRYLIESREEYLKNHEKENPE